VVYFCPLETPLLELRSNNALHFLWNTGESTPFISVTDTGTYWVMRTTQDDCHFIDTFKVKFNCSSPYFPNAFTPNGLNPEFKAISTDWIQGKLVIYNRWGEKIYEGEAWKGENASEGVYFYRWDGINLKGEKIQKMGSVTVLR
jgi:hypothetical protein